MPVEHSWTDPDPSRRKILSALAEEANVLALGSSALGLMVEGVMCTAGPEGCAAGVALYTPLNNIEGGLGYVSFGLTVVADYDFGKNSWNRQTGEISISQDTIATGILAGVGGWSPEALTDFIINFAGTAYTFQRKEGTIPDFGSIKLKTK